MPIYPSRSLRRVLFPLDIDGSATKSCFVSPDLSGTFDLHFGFRFVL